MGSLVSAGSEEQKRAAGDKEMESTSEDQVLKGRI